MNERIISANRIGLLGIVGNIFLFIIKIIVGLISSSRSMIADSFNSAGDIFASFMTYIGNKISLKKADNDHNLGHGKAEYIFAMIISIVIIYVSIRQVINSVLSIINKKCNGFSVKK